MSTKINKTNNLLNKSSRNGNSGINSGINSVINSGINSGINSSSKSSINSSSKSSSNNVNTNNNNNDKSMFSNTYLLIFIAVISLSFIGYAVYYYYYNFIITSNNNILANSSFYGHDITLYQPLFQEIANKMTDCIQLCENNILCDGVTYNNDTQICSGTKKGQIRNESSNISAWVKPPSSKIKVKDTKLDFTKAILLGYTHTPKVVKSILIQNPYTIGFFAYSFNLTIYDFNKNYGAWRHIFHRGTSINTNVILNYQSWENLIVDFPMQSIGVWLSPFTNNLRIAVTTTSLANTNSGSYEDAFEQKCSCVTSDCYITDMPNGKWVDKSKSGDGSIVKSKINTHLEFFDSDLQNIPINKQINITVNFQGTDAEVYFDGKIVKIVKLDGIPTITNTNLYAMYDNTFGGEISNLLYYPEYLKLPDIKSILELAPPPQINSSQ